MRGDEIQTLDLPAGTGRGVSTRTRSCRNTGVDGVQLRSTRTPCRGALSARFYLEGEFIKGLCYRLTAGPIMENVTYCRVLGPTGGFV